MLLGAAAGPALGAMAPGVRSGVGLNLATWDYFSPDFPLIDQFKRSSGWLTQCDAAKDASCRGFSGEASAWDTREQARLELDEQGWVKRLPAADDRDARFRSVAVLLFNGNAGSHPAGKYVVTYDGKGVLAHDLIGRKLERESKPGRDVVEVSNRGDGGWRIAIQATDPKDPLRHIRVFPPGGACARDLDRWVESASSCDARTAGAFVPFEKFPAERLWHPRFVQDLRGFRVLRFMDWGKTNNSVPATWASRPRLDSAHWSGDGGVPLEAMLDLSRTAGADPWLNLPTQASDDYVRQFAKLLRAQLGPGRTAIVEYSNEPWNAAFPVARWIQQQARAQWPVPPRGTDDAALGANWYAQRAVQACRLVKAEWPGADAPVRCVLNGQAANPGLSAQMLACPLASAALGAACARSVDALAIAPYFGGYIGAASLRGATRPWERDSDGGLGRLFQELTADDGRSPLKGVHPDAAPAGALALARQWTAASKALADKHGLPLWAYEAGQHLTVPPGDEDPAWLALVVAANRDPRMGRAYTRYLADWRAAGGQVMVLFNHMATPSKWGVWGLKESQFTDTAEKWQAVLPYRDTVACWWPGCGAP